MRKKGGVSPLCFHFIIHTHYSYMYIHVCDIKKQNNNFTKYCIFLFILFIHIIYTFSYGIYNCHYFKRISALFLTENI